MPPRHRLGNPAVDNPIKIDAIEHALCELAPGRVRRLDSIEGEVVAYECDGIIVRVSQTVFDTCRSSELRHRVLEAFRSAAGGDGIEIERPGAITCEPERDSSLPLPRSHNTESRD